MRSALALVLVCVAACRSEGPDAGRSDSRSASTPDASALQDARPLTLSSFSRVHGTPYVMATSSDPAQQARLDRSGYGDGGGPIRNYLFYDLATSQSRWLLGAPTGAIIETAQVTAYPGAPVTDGTQGPDDAGGPVVAFFYGLLSGDTNGDGRLDTRDAVDLAMSFADGRGFTVLAEDAGETGGWFWKDAGHVIVFIDMGRRPRALEVDMATLTAKGVPLAPAPATRASAPAPAAAGR